MRTPTRILSVSAIAAALFLGGPVAAVSAAPAPHATAPAISQQIAAVGDICYSDLPSQAHDTLDLIDQGGPYPYPQDGTVFQNREGLLPKQSSGYYHEYTVETPGSPDRGARRIIAGQQSEEDYYTADHYESFDLVDFGC
ncbi:ribonuclease domain-containing protein [Streptomyces sp. TS71-3]|uniref:ribonuclease domain-containing protein n=1 Tax=Streptomyces sp. TS71-3 TaxID=2733862 RepID=UPI001B1B7327|nr:ribonuclease [Streptomyces sp. TS71-3]GHJ41144.1 ribonuclease N1 [Streptomyces sp. TS71-3]